MWCKEPSLILIQKKNWHSKKKEKSQAPNKTVDTSKSNKNDTVKEKYKSRSTQRTDTFNTVDKSRSVPVTNLSNISTRIEKPIEIDIVKDNTNLSDFYLQGDYLEGITPDILFITRINKIKKTPDN